MAVRAFTTSDILDCATGALATGTFGTQAVIVKRAATGAWHTFLALHNSGGTALTQFAYSNVDEAVLWINGVVVTGPAAFDTATWGLVVIRKATGAATARFSLYNFTTGTWTHAAGSQTSSDWTAPGASGSVRFRWESFDQFDGRVAVRAAWNSLPWSADAAGDAAVEAAGLETSLQNWVDASPDALWAFNQDAVTTAVEDITGGGADQTSRTGTTVVTDDDPPGFTFTLGGSDTIGIATGSGGGTGAATGVPERVGTAGGAGGGAGAATGVRERIGQAIGLGGGAGQAAGVREVVGVADGGGGGVGHVLVLPPVIRGGSTLLERAAPSATGAARTTSTAALLSRRAPSTRGGT